MKGNAAVEFVLSLMVFAVLFTGFLSVIRSGRVTLRAASAARLGTFLWSTNRLDRETVEREMTSLLARSGSPETWMVETGRVKDIPSASFYRMAFARASCGTAHGLVSERAACHEASQ